MKEDSPFPGFLIAFDGVDSSGKETQVGLLADRLRAMSRTVRMFASPDYTTPSGQELKARLQNKMGVWQKTPWQEKMGFFATNRQEHRDEVNAALKAGEIVLYDRYVPSGAFITIEALAEDNNLTREAVWRIIEEEEYEAGAMPREDVSIFLDVPPAIADKLLNKRKQDLANPDEYTDHISVQERLYEEYETLIAANPTRFIRVTCVAKGQLLSPDVIAENVWQGLLKRIPELHTE